MKKLSSSQREARRDARYHGQRVVAHLARIKHALSSAAEWRRLAYLCGVEFAVQQAACEDVVAEAAERQVGDAARRAFHCAIEATK